MFSVAVPLIAILSLYVLQQDTWVKGEALWLISRASAMVAFVVLTLIVIIGIVLSHPRNKDTWRLAPRLLPWHQALMLAMFVFLGLHIFFTVTDPKSGITFHQMWYPIHAHYYPAAMMLGTFGLYSLIAISLSVAVRKWFKLWLPIHRFSAVTWILVFLHGIYGGSDTHSLRPIYFLCFGLLVSAFVWRHWVSVRPKQWTMDRKTYSDTTQPTIQQVEGTNKP